MTTMTAKRKTTTPDAAQRKAWKAELRSLETQRRKIRADFRNEQKRLIKEAEKAHKAVQKFMARVEKQLPAREAEIDRRAGILRGRLGL